MIGLNSLDPCRKSQTGSHCFHFTGQKHPTRPDPYTELELTRCCYCGKEKWCTVQAKFQEHGPFK